MDDTAIIYVIDGDTQARETVVAALAEQGSKVHAFASVDEFIVGYESNCAACLVVDMQLIAPGSDLHAQLRTMEGVLPVIVVAGSCDVRTAVSVMRQGALTVLQKPCLPEDLRQSVNEAVAKHKVLRQKRDARKKLRERYSKLTQSEQQVLANLAQGKPNKAIATDLNLSLRTVEMRRATILRKMEAATLAELLRMEYELRDGEPQDL
ncbi:MAG: response regulator transcription factor [Planctomycetota bacterium]